jgi:hypothetical protein
LEADKLIKAIVYNHKTKELLELRGRNENELQKAIENSPVKYTVLECEEYKIN